MSTIPENDAYQTMEIGFLRKSDKTLVYVKLSDLFKNFKSADFINNEIVLKGQVCILDSFQQKPETVVLGVVKVANGGDGTYSVGGTSYNENHEFTVNKGSSVAITITPAENAEVESVVDGGGNPHLPVDGVVTLTVNAAMSLTITFKAKVI